MLNVEARPYQRVSGRLTKPNSFHTRPVQLPSPPPDANAADEEAAAKAVEREQQDKSIRAWQQDVINEIAMLDYAILRMELTTKSNEAERERYAAEKTEIIAKQQDVRDNIENLRVKLEEAKQTLAVRKTYDELTEKITSSKMLKPRDEQAAAHAKLDEEIAELQEEVESFKRTWTERRVQFGRISEEANEMLRMIKDEKEEAERKEGMMKDADEGEDGEGSTTRGGASAVGTPRPDAGTPVPGEEASQTVRAPPRERLASLSQANSGAATPAALERGLEDTEMGEAVAKDDDSSEIEEGEEEEDEGLVDTMDES